MKKEEKFEKIKGGRGKIEERKIASGEILQKDVKRFQEIYDLNNIRKRIELPPFAEEQIEKIKEIQEKDPYLELHYLPELEITENTKFPDSFTKFPEKMFRWLKEKKIKPESLRLKSQYILIDSRPKPNYQPTNQGGRQLYENDQILEEIIKELRENKEIKSYDVVSRSRYFTSYQEIKDRVLPRYAKELNLSKNQVLLPTFLQFYLIGNLYHKELGQTNTREWFNDKFGSSYIAIALDGGSSENGGLSDVAWFGADACWWGLRAFRPLIIIVEGN